MKKVTDDQWGWIVPLILLIAILIAIATGCGPFGDEAQAAQSSPSPAPSDGVERAIGINVAGIIGAGLFVGVMLLVAIRSIRKNSN